MNSQKNKNTNFNSPRIFVNVTISPFPDKIKPRKFNTPLITEVYAGESVHIANGPRQGADVQVC